jgi:photosystem II stability/assembly factor-like uncharacterized protein
MFAIIDKASRNLSRFIGITLFMLGLMFFAGCDDGTDPGPEPVVKIQWSQTNGPDGGNINSLAASGNYVLVGTDHGIFSSDDNGETWKAENSGLTNKSIRSVAAGNRGIVVGTEGGGVFISPLPPI